MSAELVIPATMTALEIRAPGGPEVLRAAQRPVPDIGPREVLVRVGAAGVNRPDLLQRAGHYPPPPGTTDIPGLEVSGEIVRVGAEVKEFGVGDEVCALVAGGGYAQYVPRDIVAAATNGRIAVIAVQGGTRADIDLRELMMKRLTISGSTLRAQPVENKGRLAAALRENVWPLFSSKSLRPAIRERFPLAEASAAHAALESGHHIGKVILLTRV